MVSLTLKVIKAKTKSNITASISHQENGDFKNWNFTGKLTELNGYVTKDGVNYDQELVSIDCPTTILEFREDAGNAVYDRCAEIFEERELQGDPNPAIDLIVEAKTLRVKPTNILVVNVKSIFVDADTQIVDNSATVAETIKQLKVNSAKNENNQVRAARAGVSRLLNKVVKTYL